MMILNEIGKIIKEKDHFAIVSHISPDGDSLGSMLGLYSVIKTSGKNADMFIDDEIPKKYLFLPGCNEIKRTPHKDSKYSCLFVLDCGDLNRIGKLKILTDTSDIVVNIDHHISNNLFGDINFIDSNASSVGEIIYQLLKINGYDIKPDTAICLYTSILTDTGGFKYSNTTSMTFNIAGDLINTGINFSEINCMVYDIKTLPQVKLMARVTSTLDIMLDGKAAILVLTKQMLDECRAKEEDASEFVNIARDIDTVEVGILIKEMDDEEYRVSLRSKHIVDVSKIAGKFGGGGHVRAAGCTIKGSMEYVKMIVIDEIKKALEVNN